MTRMGLFLQAAWLAVLAVTLAAPARGDDQPVDLELVLAVDISLSMDGDEQRLQRNGYITALRHENVVAAIGTGAYGRIALTYVEWAGVGISRIVVPWRVIDGEETANAFADELAAASFNSGMRTSISNALILTGGMFAGNGYDGHRKVIDVSGDGPNNQGMPAPVARDIVVSEGVTINGLPLLLKEGEQYRFFDIEDLDAYYQNCVIGGVGAFIVPARSLAEFPAAVLRKMVLEIAGPVTRIIRAQYVPGQEGEAYDCLVGEKRWRQWLDQGESFPPMP